MGVASHGTRPNAPGLPVLRLALHAGRRGEDIRPAARQGIRHFLVRALAGAVGQPASAASVAYVAQRSVPISCSSPFTFPTPHPSLYIVSGEIGAIQHQDYRLVPSPHAPEGVFRMTDRRQPGNAIAIGLGAAIFRQPTRGLRRFISTTAAISSFDGPFRTGATASSRSIQASVFAAHQRLVESRKARRFEDDGALGSSLFRNEPRAEPKNQSIPWRQSGCPLASPIHHL